MEDSPSVLMIAGRTVVGWSVRELYIYVSHSMLCYGLYFINMKMVFPLVQLCLTIRSTSQLQLAGIFRQIRLSDIFLRNSVLDRVIIKFLSGKLVQSDFEK